MFRYTLVVLAGLTAAASAAPVPAAVTPIPVTKSPGYALPADITAPAPVGTPKITFSQCRVDGPYIAMTFDDGPHVTNTPRLLDILQQRRVRVTFFVVGQCAAEYPEIMKQIAAEGHEIASHSWSHPQLSTMSETGVREQLQRTHNIIVQTTGTAPKLMRPPYGAFTSRQRAWANGTWGYKCILWDVDPLDWKIRSADHVRSAILKGTVPGSIILSHDIHRSTIDAMPGTLDGLLAKGFEFVTVSELLAMDRPLPPKPKATPLPKTAPTSVGNPPEAAPAPAPAPPTQP